MVGGDHHAGGQEIVDPGDAQSLVGDAVGAAVLDLQAGGVVVEAVGHDIVVEVPALRARLEQVMS